MAEIGEGPVEPYWKKSADYEEHFEADAYYSTYLTSIEPGSYPEKIGKDFHQIFANG